MNSKYEPLFQSVKLRNGVKTRNRFVLAPLTHVSSNDDGSISEEEIPYIEKRSKDVGLSLTAASYVHSNGKAFPGQASVSKDEDIEGLSRQAEAMKKNGAKALIQIHHGGARALHELTPNQESIAPSDVEDYGYGKQEKHASRAMSEDEILEAIKAFGKATKIAIEAGFDGVEIHGANHYLIHQFVSPYYNRRTDKWGDTLSFPLAVVKEVTQVVKEHGNKDFIVGYRFSPEEPQSPGISMDITKNLIEALIEQPIDYLHVSLFDVHSTVREGEYKDQKRATLLLEWINERIPLIGLGSIFTADEALEAYKIGLPLIAIGRELLLDPDFVGKIRDGKEDEIISKFDPKREDKHGLTNQLWGELNKGLYPLPRTDEKE